MEFEKIEFKKVIGELTERKPINKCAFEFADNPTKVYYSGQLICGIVQLTLNEKMKTENIIAKVIGKAYVRWNEYDGQNNRAYKGKEIFFDKRIELIHESNDTIQLMPGSYTYTLQFKLPDNLPSSLEYKYGYIRYKACVILESFWSNEEFDFPFTVIEVSHLTPHMREPVTTQNSNTFFCYLCCLPSDPLETAATIPCSGYVPRQTIDVYLDVNNRSSQSVSEFTVQFIQKIQYFTDANSSMKKTDKIVLKQESIQGCEAGQQQQFNVSILVPTVPPSSRHQICNIIKIKYFIRIFVSVPCCRSDPVLYLPINIGSNPIQENPTLPCWINPIANDFH